MCKENYKSITLKTFLKLAYDLEGKTWNVRRKYNVEEPKRVQLFNYDLMFSFECS